MRILVIGSQAQLEEVKSKFGNNHENILAGNSIEFEQFLKSCDVVFDFTIHEDPSRINQYKEHPTLCVFLNASYTSLSQLDTGNVTTALFGFCGLPTFLNREILEVSLSNGGDRAKLQEVCAKLGTEFCLVADRVGLVTPRVICMIINEAYCTVQEGTATRGDIDLAMKLGTGYPFGPFEWCRLIGSKYVCRLLDAVFKDTGDERYKICRMLKDAADSGEG